ncbi:MAG: hypothetical protein EH225_09740 [Calditrichaeota bacterium]|nr:hypothetical protein [Calditrichota bacterium]RQW01138.1 MAG: hypothetical protein EH225_09740 [Calditrichota bacterium]
MKQWKYFAELIFILFLISLIGFFCQSDQKKIVFEKERIMYQEKIQSAVDRLDMKVAELRAIAEEQPEDNQQLLTVATELELLGERLNQKLGELNNVSVGDWEETRSEIDQMMIEMEERLRQAEQLRQQIRSG